MVSANAIGMTSTLWTSMDDLADKTEKVLDKLTSIITDGHDSLLRRTIAINIEYEIKLDLLTLDTTRYYDDERVLSANVYDALEIGKNANEKEALRIWSEWFPTADDGKVFTENMQLLKSVSSTVHPTSDLKGTPLTYETAKVLLEQEFTPPKESRAYFRGWIYDQERIDAVAPLLNKLVDRRKRVNDPTLLHA